MIQVSHVVKRHRFYDQKLDGIKFRLDNWEIQLFGSTKERKELRIELVLSLTQALKPFSKPFLECCSRCWVVNAP